MIQIDNRYKVKLAAWWKEALGSGKECYMNSSIGGEQKGSGCMFRASVLLLMHCTTNSAAGWPSWQGILQITFQDC